MYQLKIINVGIFPPPYGGVSNHLKRLIEFLEVKGIACLLFDISGKKKNRRNVINISWAKCILTLLFTNRSIVHFHNFSSKNSLVYFFLSFRHYVILSFHNERFLTELNSKTWILRKIAFFFLNKVDYVIVDGQFCKKLAEKIIRDNSKIKIIPEFIPPMSVPELAVDSIKKVREKYKYVLASNAFQISFYNGQDLYGLDLLVRLLDKLVNHDNLDVGIVFLLPNIGDEKYFKRIKEEIAGQQLEERFVFITEPVEEASSLWRISDAVIRATNTDGNSLTIHEALFLRVPVVASDCTERPNGCILFKNRNLDDLHDKAVTVIKNIDFYRNQLKELSVENNAISFLNLYTKLQKQVAYES